LISFAFRGVRCSISEQNELGQFSLKVALKDMRRPHQPLVANVALIDLKNRFATDNVELQYYKTMDPMCLLKCGEFLAPNMVQTRFWKSGQLVDKQSVQLK